MIHVPKVRSANVRREGDRVLVLLDGRAVMDLPWQAALDVAKALTAQARAVEEEEKAERIAMDQAILLRAGAGIGLTNHPKIQAEAAKEAAWNSDLRRYMPGGVRSKTVIGAPAIQVAPPTTKESHP